MVLSDPTRILALPEIAPDTMMVSGSSDSAASVRAARSLTVTVSPAAPPVVPPLRVAKPIGAGSAAWRRASSLRALSSLVGEAEVMAARRAGTIVNFILLFGRKRNVKMVGMYRIEARFKKE